MLTVGSLFSGVGGFDLGLERAGMRVLWQVEFDKQARSVLRRHWPTTDLHEDVRHVGRANLAPVDLICGGFPCQDLSVAGRRAGLAGERSGLFHEFMRIVAELAPRWVLAENVPGLLSSNGGRDMGTVLGTLGQLGYGYSYRVLDSQHFGVPQRRRRVFIVGCLGGICPPEILFEPDCLPGDFAARGEAAEDAAACFDVGPSGARGSTVSPTLDARCKDGPRRNQLAPLVMARALLGKENCSHDHTLETYPLQEVGKRTGASTDDPRAGIGIGNAGDVMYSLQAGAQHGVVGTLSSSGAGTARTGNARSESDMIVAHTLRAEGFDASEDGTGRGTPLVVGALTVGAHPGSYNGQDAYTGHLIAHIAFNATQDPISDVRAMGTLSDQGAAVLAATVRSNPHNNSDPSAEARMHVWSGAVPRRLTPRECERLQGFPDDWTRWADDGREIADGPRYRMCGNAVTVSVIEWIGKRLANVPEYAAPELEAVGA